MHYTIYRITNKLNGKTYTGMHKTDNLDDGYMGSGKLIKRAIKKHDIKNFEKEILFIFDNEEDMKNKEKELVVLGENSYNLCEGGKGGFSYINRLNLNIYETHEEWNKRKLPALREGYTKYIKSGEHGNNIRKSWEKYKENNPNFDGHFKGKKHKPESIEKIKISIVGKQQGTKNSQYGTCWITNGSENKKIKKEELDSWFKKGYNKGRIAAEVLR